MLSSRTGHAGNGDCIVAVGGSLVALRLPFNQALLPELVPPEDLLAAASLTAAQWNLGRVIGPSLAAVTIAVWGYEWAFGSILLSLFAVIVAMLLVRVPHHLPAPAEGIWRRIAKAPAPPGTSQVVGPRSG